MAFGPRELTADVGRGFGGETVPATEKTEESGAVERHEVGSRCHGWDGKRRER
jgi:hypothetical protein